MLGLGVCLLRRLLSCSCVMSHTTKDTMSQRSVISDTQDTTVVQQSAGGALRQRHRDINQLCAQEILYHDRKINQTQIHPTSSCVSGARDQNKTETRKPRFSNSILYTPKLKYAYWN